MTGRGLDQILQYPSVPEIHEPYLKNALDYVSLAEERSGPIPRGVSSAYVWGDALPELERLDPAARIINLETTITTSNQWEHKGINYRMHPRNIGALTAARIDCCVLSNNHVLDWGAEGLLETLEALSSSGIGFAGAGKSLAEAAQPAVIEHRTGRALIFGLGSRTSGVPAHWAASAVSPGVYRVDEARPEPTLRELRSRVLAMKRPGDIVVASIHWGDNWGYEIPREQLEFAHALIDGAGVDLVHGHSSHHAKGIEVHRGKLILYGCGDLITDYEGIEGYGEFRPDLCLLYFPELDCRTGRLESLELVPMRLRRFRLERASLPDARWLESLLTREGQRFRTRTLLRGDRMFLDFRASVARERSTA